MWQGNHVPVMTLRKRLSVMGRYPFKATDKTLTNFYGSAPQGFVKLQAGKNTSFQIGALPTLIGAEYTFSFENMDIERGLLWNQENAVNRRNCCRAQPEGGAALFGLDGCIAGNSPLSV